MILILNFFSDGSVFCSFENQQATTLCGYTQDNTDQFDWTLNQKTTATANTGPVTDHTYGSYAGHYVYIESSPPQKVNDTARLIRYVILKLMV